MKYKEYTGKMVKIMCCSKCNNKCSHCYINYKGDIDPDELLSIVKKLKKKYQIKLNGTEPLLNERYLESFKEAEEEIVLTNGLIFKNNLQLVDKIIDAGLKRICMSYHFTFQESISKVKTSYLDEIIPKIREKGIDLELMCTISSTNYDKIIYFCDKAVELGANYIYFIEYMQNERVYNKDDDKFLLTDEMRNTFFKLLNEAREKYSKDVLMVTRCGNFGRSPYSNNKNFDCPAYTDQVVMTPDYKIYPCNLLISEKEEIGYYKDGKIFVRDDYESDTSNCLYCLKRRCNK